MDLKNRLSNSASLQKNTGPTVSDIEEDTERRTKIPKYEDKVKELEEKLINLERENLKLKTTNNIKPKWEDYKKLTVGVDVEDFEAFQDVVEKIGPVYQPHRLGAHKTSHNPFFRALFSCLIARVDKIDLDMIDSEEDIYNEVSKLFS
jgi:hypothetical protein